MLNTSSFAAIFMIFKDLSSSIILTKLTLLFTQLDTKEQVNILLYSYPPNKSNALNQDIIKFVINFLKISGRFDKPLFSLNQHFIFSMIFTIFLFAYMLIVCYNFFLLENNFKFVAYNWLQISYINTLLINSSLFLLFLFVINCNLQTLNVLCCFIISVWLIINVESFVFLCFFI